MTNPAVLHARIMALPIDKQLHVAGDMVATGRLPLLRAVEPLLRVIEINLAVAIRAAEQKEKEGRR